MPSSPWQRLITRTRQATLAEITILFLVVVLAGSLWAFIALAEDVADGETPSFDRRILLGMRSPADLADPIGPPWVEELARDMTALGGVGALTILSLSIAGFLALQRKWHTVLLLIVSIAGGLALSSLLKHSFDRPRPDLVPHGSLIYTSSFPSGHSMMSAVTYLTLAALLMRTVSSKRIKFYVLILALLLCTLVGLSRIYLGVHWPTDVLAGWTIGAAWAIACWLTARWLQSRGQIEPETTIPGA